MEPWSMNPTKFSIESSSLRLETNDIKRYLGNKAYGDPDYNEARGDRPVYTRSSSLEYATVVFKIASLLSELELLGGKFLGGLICLFFEGCIEPFLLSLVPHEQIKLKRADLVHLFGPPGCFASDG